MADLPIRKASGSRTVHDVLAESLERVEHLKRLIERLRSIDRAQYPAEAVTLAMNAAYTAEAVRARLSGLVGSFSAKAVQQRRRQINNRRSA